MGEKEQTLGYTEGNVGRRVTGELLNVPNLFKTGECAFA